MAIHRRAGWAAAGFAATALAGGSALAQTDTGAAAKAAATQAGSQEAAIAGNEVVKARLSASAASQSAESSLKTGLAPSFQLLASSSDQTASLSLGFDISWAPRPGSFSQDHLTLTAAGNLDDQGDAKLVGLTGLSTGTTLKFGYTHFGGRFRPQGLKPADVQAAVHNCLGTRDVKPADCETNNFATGLSAFVAKYAPDRLEHLLDQVLPDPIHFWGVEAAVNQATYSFLQRTTFTVEDESHAGVGGSAYAGLLFNHGRTALTATYTYKPNWDENDSVSLCRPVTGGADSECLTSHDGRPVRDDRSIVSLELRHAFYAAPGHPSKFAIAPQASFDVGQDAYSVSLPLYFAADSAGKLRSGVRAVYLNQRRATGGREGDFTVALFVGVPFSVFSH